MAPAHRQANRPVEERVRGKIGRPRAVRADDTRRVILDVARQVYADRGYNLATNKDVAEASHMTTAALYYHFPSKRDLYMAVYTDAQQQVYDRFEAVIEGLDTFAAQIDAVLDAAHQLNNEDPSLARFLGAFRVDAKRNVELAEGEHLRMTTRQSFFGRIVDLGVRTGEIDQSQRGRVAAVVLSLIVGLTDAMSDDQSVHAAAVEGIKALLDGKLVHPAMPDRPTLA